MSASGRQRDATPAGQIPCPFCGTPVAVDAASLLHGDGFSCSGCGAALAVDRDRSADALDSLRKFHDESAANAQAARAARGGGEGRAELPARGRPRRNRP